MSPSMSTLSVLTASIKTLATVPPAPADSPHITEYDLDKTVKYIHTDIKAEFKFTSKKITANNDTISSMLVICIDTNNKKKKK